MSPFLWIISQIRCTPSFIKKQKCDSTCAWEGGEEGKGTNLPAKIIFNITITLLLPLHLIFWASNQVRRIYIIRGPGPHFSSELSLLAAHQNKYVLGIWQGKEPRLQVHGIFFFFFFVICLLVFLSFFWKGLVVFIYCKQVGRAYKRSFVQQVWCQGGLLPYLSTSPLCRGFVVCLLSRCLWALAPTPYKEIIFLLFFTLFPLSSFSCCNTRGCSNRQTHNGGTLKEFNVVPSDFLSWHHFPLKWLLSPQILTPLSLPCLISTLIKFFKCCSFTCVHMAPYYYYQTLQNKEGSRSLPLLARLTLENEKPLGILMEVIRTSFSPEQLIFFLSHLSGLSCAGSHNPSQNPGL